MPIALRPARTEDFDYCADLYFTEMEGIIQELGLDKTAHAVGFRQQWEVTQVRLITLHNIDVGWLQSTIRDDALFLSQFFVDRTFQGRGIGTEVINRLIAEARLARQAMTLGVVKTNRARHLYERLGFRITHQDDRKFYMRRDPGSELQIS
jgi:ribosomal protein S18 acetylase RimI-like enzyme